MRRTPAGLRVAPASAAASVALGALLVLSACAPAAAPAPSGDPTSAAPAPTPTVGTVQPSGDPADVVTGLASPWSVVRVEATDEREEVVLASERNTGVIDRIVGGEVVPLGAVPGVVARGEGGLLGLAWLDDGDGAWVYAYLTADRDNRIVRMPYVTSSGGTHSLGAPELVLDGLAAGTTHNGGRIAFGPDGMLYATVGDAGNPDSAQDPDSLNGKILRMTPTGDTPDDNPTDGSLVYSLGHRNPQGIAWDDAGQLWAAEFGQDTWDEFNRIDAGANYGWPVVEGTGGDPAYVDPVVQWGTDDASPSGLAYVDGTFFVAGLGGERLWSITVDPAATDAASAAASANATAWYADTYGRIRDVMSGPDGTLWFVTNNTDGRGDPRDGDDRILQVGLAPATASSASPAAG